MRRSRRRLAALAVDGLRAYLPELAKEAYRSEHRHVLEYMVKSARQALMDHLCEQFDAVAGRNRGYR